MSASPAVLVGWCEGCQTMRQGERECPHCRTPLVQMRAKLRVPIDRVAARQRLRVVK